MKKTIQIFNSVDELSLFFAEQLARNVNNTPEGEYFSVAVSGGSTPRVVFQFMVSHYRNKIDWEKLLIFWGDERCVDPENDESNFKMVKESLLDHVPIPASNVFRVMGENNPVDETLRYSKIVREHLPLHNNIPQFDFVMLGLGEDGHTASIFPGNLQLFNSETLFEVVEHPQTMQKRITITGTVINQAQTVAFLVTGTAKAEMVTTLLEQKKGWEELPASHIYPKNSALLWLLDDKAAAKLKNTTTT